jgi:hypothetical protein
VAAPPQRTIRAASLVVQSCLNLPWKDFTDLMHQCWEQSTALANWGARELDRRDVVRLPNMKKLPPMPAFPKTRKGAKWLKGLYGLASVSFNFEGGFWKGAAQCASSLLRAVERKYRKERYQIVWGGQRFSARYRYPYPYPVHANHWNAEMREGRPVLVWKAPGSRTVELQLRGGPEFARQLADFRRVATGEAKKCQLLLLRQRASEGCHRRTTQERVPGGGERTHYRIMAKLIVEAPVQSPRGERVLTLCTDPAALWVAELDGRQAWVLNADHVKRACDWQELHRVRRQRWAQDCKAERRGDPRRRKQFQGSRERACSKHERRMKSWCQEAASSLARFAQRQRVGLVAYLDVDQSFLPGFPWSQLKSCLANALAGYGIALQTSGSVPEEVVTEEGNVSTERV